MPIVRKGKELLEISKCKLGVIMNGLLYILMNIGNVLVEQSSLIKEVERKLSIIPKEKPNIIVITVGGRKGENKESRDSKG